MWMYKKYAFGLVAALTLTLAGCGGGSTPDDVAHSDAPTLVITADTALTAGNALDIAAEVYRVVAVDVPYTASEAMDPLNAALINPDACTVSTALSDGGSGGMMGSGMAMDMVFNNCVLRVSPSSHTLTVNGRCSNSDSGTVTETVTGGVISLTTLKASLGAVEETVTLHDFSIRRTNDSMNNARGTLHGLAGDVANIVTFATSTSTPFAGTASEPTAGVMVVTGANNSRLRLSIVDNMGTPAFTLEVDADGDGAYDNALPLVERDWSTDFWLALIP
jgi:hypothetical protein